MLRRLLANLATPGLILSIAAIMAGLYAADRFLAALEAREISTEARRYYESGESLLKSGASAEAVKAFERAHSLDREDRAYELALAQARIDAGEPDRAIADLQQVLDADSNDGEANLLVARALTKERQFEAADAYYHRAIYGTWPRGQSERATGVRMELVKLLAQQNAQKELLAELLLLEQEAKSNRAVARQLPGLYVQSGSLLRAEDAYRVWLHVEPNNPEAYSGLAQVELDKGDYRLAQLYYSAAARRNPQDKDLVRDEQLAREAEQLDPTARRLGPDEILRRTGEMLERARTLAIGCGLPQDSPLIAQSGLLLDKPKAATTEDLAEARLDAARHFTMAAPQSCAATAPDGDLLRILLKKIAGADSPRQ